MDLGSSWLMKKASQHLVFVLWLIALSTESVETHTHTPCQVASHVLVLFDD